jgi:hypothetical protein
MIWTTLPVCLQELLLLIVYIIIPGRNPYNCYSQKPIVNNDKSSNPN